MKEERKEERILRASNEAAWRKHEQNMSLEYWVANMRYEEGVFEIS